MFTLTTAQFRFYLVLGFTLMLQACRGWDVDGNDRVNVWTWIGGSNTVDASGVYGTKGTAAANNVPGARSGAASWVDGADTVWLFGGAGTGGRLNDLWKFTPAIGQWTWVTGSETVNQTGVYGTKGTADANNVPGAREGASSWIDSTNTLWLFGGNGYAVGGTGALNDLWKFNPTTGQWTWVAGSDAINQAGIYGTKGTPTTTTTPGARMHAVSWIDSTNTLWLFGGEGYDSAGAGLLYLNDLWKLNIGTGQWTWVSGNNVAGQAGVYGTKGTADSANVPGGRTGAAAWIDNANTLWLFGGFGFGSASSGSGHLNDLWKFNPATGQWTWVAGSNAANQAGTYGTKGSAAADNVPGARQTAAAWIDNSNTLWLFAGNGYASVGTGNLNDLWKFNIAAGHWTWVAGSNATNQVGVYGTQGTAATANAPGARADAAAWIDSSDNLWLFGGLGYGNVGTGTGKLNDRWRYAR